MNLKQSKILKENLVYIAENIKLAKQLFDQGKISKEDFESLLKADPTPQKKYSGWMVKMFIQDKVSIDNLRNTIEEFDTFLKKGKAKTKDINAFKSFKELRAEVEELNQSGEGVSAKELENDYEVIINNADLYIAVPHTHEASRKLGLSKFAFRDCEGGGKDSAWCTTYKAPDHFDDYYYNQNITFYYIRVLSKELIAKLKKAFPSKYKELIVVALAVKEDDQTDGYDDYDDIDGQIDGYDGLDNQIPPRDIEKYTKIIGIS